MPVKGQSTAFLIGQVDPAAQVRAEDPVLFNQIRDGLLLLVGPPAGHGHHEESNRHDIHDRGSYISASGLVSEASAKKWDTTGNKGMAVFTAINGRRGPGHLLLRRAHPSVSRRYYTAVTVHS